MPVFIPILGIILSDTAAVTLGSGLLVGSVLLTHQQTKGLKLPFSVGEDTPQELLDRLRGEPLGEPVKEPEAAPKGKPLPIPYWPGGNAEDDTKTCVSKRRESYEKRQPAGGVFGALNEKDKDLILTHLCETEAGQETPPSMLRDAVSALGVNLAQVKTPRNVSPRELDTLWAQDMLPTLRSLDAIKNQR